MQTPENYPPGEVFKLDLTVQEGEARELLANLSKQFFRQNVPEFLHVLSLQSYTPTPEDYVDGNGDIENNLLFRSYRKKVTDYDRKVFHPSEGVALQGRAVKLRIHLGAEVAQWIMNKPFYPPTQNVEMGVYYQIPGNEPVDPYALEELTEYVRDSTHPTYKGLKIVSKDTAMKSLYTRSQQRSNDILQR